MGVSASAVSRVVGVDVHYKNFNSGKAQKLAQRLAVIGVGNSDAVYGTDKYEGEGSAAVVGEKYGYGSPLHLVARQLYPVSGGGAEFPVTFYPLIPAAGAAAASGAIGLTGSAAASGSGKIHIGGVSAEFSYAKGAVPADVLASAKIAINSVLEMPAKAGEVAAGSLPLTSRHKGKSSNKISLVVECDDAGLVFSTTAFTGGALDPSVQAALDKIGPVWETVILNTFDYSDASVLDIFQSFSEARWSVLEKKPLMVAHGCVDDFATRTAISDIRKTDAGNFLIVSVGSRELPCVVAAKGLISDIMTTANSNPACGYHGLLSGLNCGKDSAQENYTTRNLSVQKGSSTNIKNGSVAELNDIITFYHPDNEGKYPSKRYVSDLVKLQNIVYNVRLIMEADDLKGAPLVPDTTPTVNPRAVQPKTVKASFYNLADSLARDAIIADADFTKKNMTVGIDSENPKRLNVSFPVKLSGNVEISSTDVYFGFYLGGE
jgi:phage tail sheath gpL-like